MGDGFGGGAIFNRASPSSHKSCVDRIIAGYLRPGQPARILDVGGTDRGFRRRATLPPKSRVVIANPEVGVGADYDYVHLIPPKEGNFDLAMIFGVMMYMERDSLLTLLRNVRQRLRGGGVLLVAEPDPKSVSGYFDAGLKKIGHSVLNTRKFIFYSKADTTALLLEAGFGETRERDDLRPSLVLPPYYVIAAKNGESGRR